MSDEERTKLASEQLERCKAIAHSMMQILAKHVDNLDIGDDEKAMNDSIEPVVETILKMQRESGMMFIDRETVNTLFLMSCATVTNQTDRHYGKAFSDIVEFRMGKPKHELTMQDLRAGLEERAAALAAKKV